MGFIYGKVELNEFEAAAKVLSNAELNVLIYLIIRCGGKDSCYPSQKTIGAALGISDRAVRYLIEGIEKAGLLVVGKKGQGNLYFPKMGISSSETLLGATSELPISNKIAEAGLPISNKIAEAGLPIIAEAELPIVAEAELPTNIRKKTKREYNTTSEGTSGCASKEEEKKEELKKRFNIIWGKYKVIRGKDNWIAAFKEFQRMPEKDRVDAENSVDAYIAAVKDREEKFIPSVVTYLSNRRWNEINTAGIDRLERLKTYVAKLRQTFDADKSNMEALAQWKGWYAILRKLDDTSVSLTDNWETGETKWNKLYEKTKAEING